MNTILEICAADIESVYAAARGGADRVELCCALGEGGLTPSIGLIEQALIVPGIKVNVLIRPRPGDFLYSEAELRTMERDIEVCRSLGVNGVVFGALTPDGDVDIEVCHRLAEVAGDMHRTFHRAFDMLRDPHRAVCQIMALGFDRILTSGQAASAMEGLDLIAGLQREFPDMTFMAAGGISPANVAYIVGRTGIREVHASAKTTVASDMRYRHHGVSMGAHGADEYTRHTTSSDMVSMIKDALSMNN